MRLSASKSSASSFYSGLGEQLYDLSGARPALDLNFASNGSLVDSVTGKSLITFTRASSGTYVDGDGVIQTAGNNVARFDHNPTTGESLGLLVEESRTNLWTYSEEFDRNNTPWGKPSSVTVTANQAVSPDGTLTADLISGTGDDNFINQAANLVSDTTYTISIYVKSAGLSKDAFRLGGDSAQFSGDFTATDSWQRFTYTFTATATGSRNNFLTRDSSNNPLGLYIWGAQLEAGSFPTSYIRTEGSTVTRSADVASITGTNFSSWYNQTEGTVFAIAEKPSLSSTVAVSISDGTSSNRVELRSSSSVEQARFEIVASGSVQYTDVFTADTAYKKLAFAYAENNSHGVANGILRTTDTSVTIPAVNNLYLGNNIFATNNRPGRIKRLTYWPTRLSNDTLQTITR